MPHRPSSGAFKKFQRERQRRIRCRVPLAAWAAIGKIVKPADKMKSDDKRTWVVSDITASTVTVKGNAAIGK